MVNVAPDVTTGMTEEQAAKAHRAPRPMVVYVYDDNKDEDSRFAVEENPTFGDNKVVVGARFFDMLRMSREDAAADSVLAKHASKAPCLVFVRPNFQVASVVRARFNARRVFSAMNSTMRKDYKNSVATVLRRQTAIQKERSSLAADELKMARLDEKIAEENNARKRARLVQQRDKLQEKLSAAEAKLAERENALYKLDPKDAT